MRKWILLAWLSAAALAQPNPDRAELSQWNGWVSGDQGVKLTVYADGRVEATRFFAGQTRVEKVGRLSEGEAGDLIGEVFSARLSEPGPEVKSDPVPVGPRYGVYVVERGKVREGTLRPEALRRVVEMFQPARNVLRVPGV